LVRHCVHRIELSPKLERAANRGNLPSWFESRTEGNEGNEERQELRSLRGLLLGSLQGWEGLALVERKSSGAPSQTQGNPALTGKLARLKGVTCSDLVRRRGHKSRYKIPPDRPGVKNKVRQRYPGPSEEPPKTSPAELQCCEAAPL